MASGDDSGSGDGAEVAPDDASRAIPSPAYMAPSDGAIIHEAASFPIVADPVDTPSARRQPAVPPLSDVTNTGSPLRRTPASSPARRLVPSANKLAVTSPKRSISGAPLLGKESPVRSICVCIPCCAHSLPLS